jgi:bifunctional non-homologous end joining protein LigD
MPTPARKTLDRVADQLEAVESDGGNGAISIGRSGTIDVSSLDKLMFPAAGVSKGDVMRYYTHVAPYLLPLLDDRPLALKRFPDGVQGKSFFQQKAPRSAPRGVRAETVTSESGERQERLIGGSLATLLYCVQLGALECNPWNARVESPEYPDYTVIDLDPGPRARFSRVAEVAVWVGEVMDELGVRGGVKTSGASGIHIFIPLPPRSSESVAERVASRIATAVATAHPREATTERAIKARGSATVYVDAGQNSLGKTVASAYSVRARAEATVSTPLRWDELRPDLDPRDFTVRTVPDRLASVGDLWAAAMRRPNPGPLVAKLGSG